jgi:hypothetical protein
VRKGSLGTWEILLSPLLLNQKRDDTGRTTTWHARTDLAAGVSKGAKHQEVSVAERNEAVEMDRGSRSALIVAPESRETDPRKPVSSQGGRRFTERPCRTYLAGNRQLRDPGRPRHSSDRAESPRCSHELLRRTYLGRHRRSHD